MHNTYIFSHMNAKMVELSGGRVMIRGEKLEFSTRREDEMRSANNG